jgi:hypothetical protein
VCTARDVVFDEAHGWDWTVTTGAPPTAEFTIEYIYTGASRGRCSPCTPSDGISLVLLVFVVLCIMVRRTVS